ncbi:MAG: type VI secretion system Vgr family protein [Formivibrio sp.]|nr:type VI secretion system Vgr family protein [Formivibrio sp.]
MFDGLLNAFASAFTQSNRLLTLQIGGDGFEPEALLPHILRGTHSISSLYRYELDCLSSNAYLELKDLLGLPVQVGILDPKGDERIITGVVTSAATLGADGGFSAYRLVIEPALALLTHRRTSRVFQDITVSEIVQVVLDEHIAANPVFASAFKLETQLSETYPARSYCLQYRESDLAFISRLLKEEGIAWRFVFTAGDTPVHTLVLFDDPYNLEQSQLGRVRFHRADGTESEDGLQRWDSSRQIGASQVSLSSFDYKSVSPNQAKDSGQIDQGTAGEQAQSSLEDYDPQSLYYGDPDDLNRYATLRQKALDRATKTFTATGTVRGLNVGEWFELSNHPVHDFDAPEQRQFVVTGETLTAQNNLPGDVQNGLAGLLASVSAMRSSITGNGSGAGNDSSNNPPFQSQLTLIRRGIDLTPDYAHSEHAKPKSNGVQTAIVVGPAGEEIHTDDLGRIKIQFHWQRPDEHPEFGANLDDRSSCWVRVACPSAGAGWGHQFLPRIGQEVLVDFIEGDIDRPLITGVLYNGSHTPPEFSGVGSLPANKTLSGIKSKEYKGSRYNELLFDDSTDQIRTKLSSEHGKTQLNMGYLAHPRTEGKAEPRGEGAELRTDAAATIRAAKGLLLTTDARQQAKGNQLDRAELVGLLKVLESIHKNLSELSNTHQAEETDTAKLSDLVTHLENWDKGSNTQGGKPDATGGQPIIAASSPCGIVLGSNDSIALAANSHIDIASVKNTQISTGRKFLVRATEQLSLFVHQMGMKLIAASGKIEIQAQNEAIEITSAKKLILTSLEEIVLQAPKITHIAQNAKIELAGGSITTQCSGTHTQKAASHSMSGGGGCSPTLPKFQQSKASYDEKFVLRYPNGKPMADVNAKVKDADNKVLWQGKTNDQGHSELLSKDLPNGLRIDFLPD